MAQHAKNMCLVESKVCSHCDSQQVESCKHFFEECPAFTAERETLKAKALPLLDELGLTFGAQSLLGFNDKLTSCAYQKCSKMVRTELYYHTCEFMRSTKRFNFV